MKERFRLDFIEYSPQKAALLLWFGRCFATSKIDGLAGVRHGTVYGDTCEGEPLRAVAYWTGARMVVVRELPQQVTP